MANSAAFFPQCVFAALDCCRLDHAHCCTRSSFWFAGKSLSLCRFSNPRVCKRITTRQCQLRHMHKLVDFPSGRWGVVGARAPGGDSPDDGDGGSEEEEDGSRTDENFTSFSSSNDDVSVSIFLPALTVPRDPLSESRAVVFLHLRLGLHCLACVQLF
jgi:hypothetical protein